MQVLWRKLNLGVSFLSVFGRKNICFFLSFISRLSLVCLGFNVFYICSANSRAALTPRNVHRTFLRCGCFASRSRVCLRRKGIIRGLLDFSKTFLELFHELHQFFKGRSGRVVDVLLQHHLIVRLIIIHQMIRRKERIS